ncbi:probable LRR receptor-like serine/threonine-protein kinase At3g47570 isoform X2 [Solanum dulcamara]|uniref:probable LRR receptor-like serine/threonine-protein kinase At3g47570 isoform X2 n=1 Tax=Solanum dulcamara TaxID=45834 RepID=UPI002486A9AF|nr:probable LRR receptor-like serine/threonine-protein kinase At3g47570 isoform X2 [Solanum dulcamara]
MEKGYIHLAIVLLLLQQMSTCLSIANITTDRTAILALQSQISLYNPHSVLARNWSTSTPVCSWIGVTCGLRHQRITALNLSSMNLNGMVPPQLGNLSFLISLDIRNNNFHGSLPEELARLRRLKMINAMNNNFTGAIPSFFGLLPNLHSLYLSFNQFSGNIPLSLFNITKLKDLGLRGNFLGGEIPQEISSLCCLNFIDLQDNKLTGSIPPTMFNQSSLKQIGLTKNILYGKLPGNICDNLPNLERLGLSANRFDGLIPPNLQNCSKLQILSLSVNDFAGTIPAEIGNLTMLRELLLGETYLKGEIPRELGYLQRLQLFGLYQNRLSGSIPASLFNISTLQILTIVDCQLSGSLPSNVGQGTPNLKEIYLGMNNLSGAFPASISNASRLTVLDLSNNILSGSIPDSLGNLEFLELLQIGLNKLIYHNPSSQLTFLTSLTRCRNLRELVIARNPLNGVLPASIGSIPKTVRGLQKLQGILIQSNMISGTIPDEICYLQNIGNLILGQNKMSGPLPSCLGNVTSLRNLYLASNKLNSSLPETLWSLQDLLVLDASSNSFSGVLSPQIGNLKAVIDIDLSYNDFSDMIPSTMGSLQKLVNLSLSHNRIDGPIPESFGKMLSLEFLDLSCNNLTGEIPKSLEALEYLKYLNVSFNKLSGEIPTGGPFANFTNLSFVSNNALCGASRLQVQPCQGKSHRRTTRKRVLYLFLYSLLGITSLIVALSVGLLILRRRKRNEPSGSTEVSSMRAHERVSYYELQQATNGFSEDNLLGTGSFSKVYKGVKNGTIFAVKVFKRELEGAFKSFDTECEILGNLRHRNLAKVITACSNPQFKALLLEYMPNGTLDKWLHSHDFFLDMLQRLDIFIDLASALDYLHNGYSEPVVHCDLKPSNILLDENMVGHLSDFGIAKLLGAEDSFRQTKTIGTIGYIAPEYGQDGLVSTSCDVYSFGIVIMEAFTGRRPSDEMFTGDLSLKLWVNDSLPTGVTQIVDADLIRPTKEPLNANMQRCLVSVMELALSCTSVSPDARINTKEALSELKKIRIQLITS